MTDRDQTAILSLNGGNSEPGRLGVYDDFAAAENRSDDSGHGLVSLGFITAAIRRSAWFLVVMTLIGPVIGLGIYFKSPHPYQASASILLTHGPYDDVQSAAANNQAMAETRAVAGIAVQRLGLQQSVSNFLSTYAATSVTDRILLVTATGPSSSQAVLRADAVSRAFLTFRANELQGQENLVLQSLNQQINQAKQHINSINAQISQLSSQPASPTVQSQIGRLRTEQTNATNALGNLQQAVIGDQTTTQPALTAALKGSVVLSVAALPHSRLKPLVTYGVFGLIAGLAVGLAVIIIRALVSDRLRQRDDIAYALDAPVRLSVGTLQARRRPTLPGRAAKRDLDLRRVVAHLRSAVPRSTHGPAGLAIVAVDNAPVVARAAAVLAASYASQGHQVVAADLSQGADLAHLLRVKRPGAHPVSHNGVNFTMVVPDRDDAALVGPLRTVTSAAGTLQAGDAPVASYSSTDVLLTLVTLDPALAADYLATWATNAVVVVTAGLSSAVRIHGVGEMVRHAGTRLVSVVLIGADKSDESLGLTPRPDEQAGSGVLRR